MKAAALIAATLLAAALWTVVMFFFALLSLASCAHPQPVAEPHWPRAEVPLSYYRTVDLFDDGQLCQPWWIAPATWCDTKGKSFKYNGCRWGCFDDDVSEVPQ